MTSSQLSYCIAFFYVGFLVFELPGAILLRVLTPPFQLGIALMAWGTATTLYVNAQPPSPRTSCLANRRGGVWQNDRGAKLANDCRLTGGGRRL